MRHDIPISVSRSPSNGGGRGGLRRVKASRGSKLGGAEQCCQCYCTESADDPRVAMFDACCAYPEPEDDQNQGSDACVPIDKPLTDEEPIAECGHSRSGGLAKLDAVKVLADCLGRAALATLAAALARAFVTTASPAHAVRAVVEPAVSATTNGPLAIAVGA